jgi:hypothetical protein
MQANFLSKPVQATAKCGLMPCRRPWLTIVMTAIVACAVPSSCPAIVVNLTTGQVLFYDDFEATPSVSKQPHKDATGDYNPTNPRIGTWSSTEIDPSWIQVTSSKTPPDPGAYRGNNYLRIFRDVRSLDKTRQPPAANPQQLLVVKAAFTRQTTRNHHIRMAQMVFVPAGEQSTRGIVQFIADSGATHCINIIANMQQTDGSVYSHTNEGSVDTGLDFAAGRWQLWQIDYKLGDPTFTLTIGSASASGLPAAAIANTLNSYNIHADTSARTPFYVDEVPESSTITLPAVVKPVKGTP